MALFVLPVPKEGVDLIETSDRDEGFLMIYLKSLISSSSIEMESGFQDP